MQLHQVSPQPKAIPRQEVKLGSTKAVTKLHSNNHLSTSAVSTFGVKNYPPGSPLGQNRAADSHATPAKLPRRHTAPIRTNQTQLRPMQTELSADHQCPQKQSQAQQDKIRVSQLNRSSFRHHSASAASFPKMFKSTKERISSFSSESSKKKTQGIDETKK